MNFVYIIAVCILMDNKPLACDVIVSARQTQEQCDKTTINSAEFLSRRVREVLGRTGVAVYSGDCVPWKNHRDAIPELARKTIEKAKQTMRGIEASA